MGASVTLLEATAPVKLPTWHGPTSVVRASEEWYFTVPSSLAKTRGSMGPTYPTHRSPRPNAKLE